MVFRGEAGDNVTVGEDVVIQGPASETEDHENLTLAIPDGAVIPDGAGITDEATLEEALSKTSQEMPETGGMELGGVEGLPEP